MDSTGANLHVASQLKEIGDIRKKLWEQAYSNIVIMNSITKTISEVFGKEDIRSISYDMYDYSITITSNKIFSNIQINLFFSSIFEKIVNMLHIKGILSDDEYTICSNRLSLLYNLVLNNDCTFVIKL